MSESAVRRLKRESREYPSTEATSKPAPSRPSTAVPSADPSTRPVPRPRPPRPKSAKKGGRTKPTKDLWKEVTARLSAPHAAGAGARAVRSATAKRPGQQISTRPATAKRFGMVEVTAGRPATAGGPGRVGFASALRAQMASQRDSSTERPKSQGSDGPDEVLWRRTPEGEVFESPELRTLTEDTEAKEEGKEEGTEEPKREGLSVGFRDTPQMAAATSSSDSAALAPTLPSQQTAAPSLAGGSMGAAVAGAGTATPAGATNGVNGTLSTSAAACSSGAVGTSGASGGNATGCAAVGSGAAPGDSTGGYAAGGLASMLRNQTAAAAAASSNTGEGNQRPPSVSTAGSATDGAARVHSVHPGLAAGSPLKATRALRPSSAARHRPTSAARQMPPQVASLTSSAAITAAPSHPVLRSGSSNKPS